MPDALPDVDVLLTWQSFPELALKNRSTKTKYITDDRQSKTPGGGTGGASQMTVVQVSAARRLFVLLLPSVVVGAFGSSCHVVPLTKYLYCTGFWKGTSTVATHAFPWCVMGVPFTHVAAPP